TGIGVLYGKRERLEGMHPFFFGGDMIRFVDYDHAEWNDVPHKFEAGTPPIASVIGLGEAVRYITQLGWDDISTHERSLTKYALQSLSPIVRIIGSMDAGKRIGTISFLIDGVHPHDVGDVLNRGGIAVRVGHHCAMPLIRHLGLTGTVRASFGVYNTREDVDRLVGGIEKVKKIFM
ncbi:MAG: aminotransferase class V-fold PLP-dependent enzyme, partial [Patescibacteria group bacterium]